MKSTNAQLMQVLTALRGCNEQGKLGFVIAKNRRRLEMELADYIEKQNEVIQRHADVDESGDAVLSKKGAARANIEIAEYAMMPCEFDPYTIDEETFTSGSLTSEQMYILDFLVKESEDDG